MSFLISLLGFLLGTIQAFARCALVVYVWNAFVPAEHINITAAFGIYAVYRVISVRFTRADLSESIDVLLGNTQRDPKESLYSVYAASLGLTYCVIMYVIAYLVHWATL